ncbi:ATP-binding protein [Streptomyces clavuligerus]|uniref:ATP-binding protein n=1 Tax=Streptomyces clavuligerus TaxID=1901 RepID=UPI000185172F|nr:ATP-binding protein [Streptomyces clavuligerus]ANW21489.1 hypothetical protein BB341_26395 [Streptomyces clavuligerus]AXU16122.1 ATP-binding protein [Streptomyces clavuligerus]MBY6306263.1 ATP-binding protein [Streptomyces clavuligerus]QCS08901.1 ATP-binding protein [Streptomyces clavuligerus]QPJ91762.1 ATP-binding protein [Streptomyces clavuligerus]
MISQSGKHCTVELQALPSRIGQIRRIVSAQLRHWRLDPLVDPAALGLTELLTNVHRHAEPDKMCVVDIAFRSDRLTVSVHDHDPRLPDTPAAGRDDDPLATSGRGLSLIAAVSETWGVEPTGDTGKTVWFTLATPPGTPEPESEPWTAEPWAVEPWAVEPWAVEPGTPGRAAAAGTGPESRPVLSH